MFKGARKTIHISAALAAMWLTACGGGGGGDAPASPPLGGAPAPAPGTDAPAPAPGTGAPAPAPGTGAPAPAPQALAWTQTSLAAQNFHTVAVSANGQVIAAGSLPGALSVSRDGGATWTSGNGAPTGDRWISVDMSANGQHIVGVGFDGMMYRSSNSGATFTRIDSTIAALTTNATQAYEGVTISDDGQRIVAAIQNGGIYVSSNGGTTFTAATGAPVAPWRAVDSSADGMVVVAAHHNGEVYISTNGGTSFTRLQVTVGGNAIVDGWYRLALSRDGNTLALAGNQQWGTGGPTTGIYVGRRAAGAWTFNQGSNVAGNYGALAMSANGDVIVASLYMPTTATGSAARVLRSVNRGVSFTQITAPTAAPANWRAIGIDANATRLVLGNGDFAANAPGRLYTSTGSVTGN
jgi:hypothetical protein